MESHARPRAHGRSADDTGGGIHPTGKIHTHHRPSHGIHSLDRLANRAAGITLKTGAEQRIHNHRRRPEGLLRAPVSQIQRDLAAETLQAHPCVPGEHR